MTGPISTTQTTQMACSIHAALRKESQMATPKGNPPNSGKAGKGPGNSAAKNVGTRPGGRKVNVAGMGKGGPGPGNKGQPPPRKGR